MFYPTWSHSSELLLPADYADQFVVPPLRWQCCVVCRPHKGSRTTRVHCCQLPRRGRVRGKAEWTARTCRQHAKLELAARAWWADKRDAP
jgi:hypothetical protein